MELLKQQTLMYQQQNSIKWGNTAWNNESSSAKSLREIQEEEQRRKDQETKKREDEHRKRDEENRKRIEEDVDLSWVAQTQTQGGKLSLREIQEQEKKKDKLNKEREAAKVCIIFIYNICFKFNYSFLKINFLF